MCRHTGPWAANEDTKTDIEPLVIALDDEPSAMNLAEFDTADRAAKGKRGNLPMAKYHIKINGLTALLARALLPRPLSTALKKQARRCKQAFMQPVNARIMDAYSMHPAHHENRHRLPARLHQ